MRRTKARNFSFLKVTTQELYCFEPSHCNNWSIEKVVDEWFRNYPIDSSHAARDGGRIGNSKKLIGVEIISEEEVSKYVGV